MPSRQNTECLEKTKEKLAPGKAFYFTDFTGLSVASIEKLRKELRKNHGLYLVLKNTIGYLAMKDMGHDEKTIQELFTGPTGIAIAFDDPIALAKVVTGHENLKVKGSIIEGTFFITERVFEFARIPSRDALYSHVVGALNVMGNFVYVLEGMLRNIISTLDAMKNKEAK